MENGLDSYILTKGSPIDTCYCHLLMYIPAQLQLLVSCLKMEGVDWAFGPFNRCPFLSHDSSLQKPPHNSPYTQPCYDHTAHFISVKISRHSFIPATHRHHPVPGPPLLTFMGTRRARGVYVYVQAKHSYIKLNKFVKEEYLGINLTKEVKDLYIENYKTLVYKVEEDTRKWRYTMFMDWED